MYQKTQADSTHAPQKSNLEVKEYKSEPERAWALPVFLLPGGKMVSRPEQRISN